MTLAPIPRYPFISPRQHPHTYASDHCNYGFILIRPLIKATIRLHTYTPACLLPYASFRFPPFRSPCSLASSAPLVFNVYSLKLYISLHCFPLFHPTTLHIQLVVVFNYATDSVLQIAYWSSLTFFWFRCTSGTSFSSSCPLGRSSR